jgi:PAS domain S-box-containing protein
MELGRASIVEYRSPRVREWVEQRVYPTSSGVSIYIREITARKRKELERDEYLRALRVSEAATALRNRVLHGIRTILESSLTSATEEELGVVCLRVSEDLTGSPLGYIGELGEDGVLRDIAMCDGGHTGRAAAGRGAHGLASGGPDAGGLHGFILQSGESVVTNDPAGHPAARELPGGHPPLTAFLGVPLKQRDRIVGVIALANRAGGYGDEQLSVVEDLAPVIAQAFERRRADLAIRESEERYRRLFEALDEGVALHEMVYDEEGRAVDYRFLEANPAFGRLTGLDHRAIIGQTVREALPGVEPGWIELYARVVATGQGEHFEREAAALGAVYAGYAYPLGERRFGVAFTLVERGGPGPAHRQA